MKNFLAERFPILWNTGFFFSIAISVFGAY